LVNTIRLFQEMLIEKSFSKKMSGRVSFLLNRPMCFQHTRGIDESCHLTSDWRRGCLSFYCC
jgi:hypothetical protein